MAETRFARGQSLIETMAIVVVAAAIAWSVFGRSNAASARAGGNAAPAKRPEAPLPVAPISLEGAQLAGDPHAKVGLVMYSDFQCPYCGKFARETMPALQEQYVKPGKVLVAFREMPLPMHPFAEKAAEAAECAGRQGKFWLFHDALFADQKTLDLDSLKARSIKLGLEPKGFETCLGGQMETKVKADLAGGDPMGVSGTPTFLVGPLGSDGRVKVTQRFSGALPLDQFQAILDRALAAVAGSVPTGR